MIDEPSSYLDVKQRLKAAQVGGGVHLKAAMPFRPELKYKAVISRTGVGVGAHLAAQRTVPTPMQAPLRLHLALGQRHVVGEWAALLAVEMSKSCCCIKSCDTPYIAMAQSAVSQGIRTQEGKLHSGHPRPAGRGQVRDRGGARPVGAGLPVGLHLLPVRQARGLRRGHAALQRQVRGSGAHRLRGIAAICIFILFFLLFC